jgi:gamma-glutamyl hydrolase
MMERMMVIMRVVVLLSLLVTVEILVVAARVVESSSWVYEKGAKRHQKIISTDRPIIGVLTLPEPACLHYGKQSIVTSNVRWIQAGGARVVPVFYDSTDDELDYILHRINGIFFTGGAVSYNPTTTDEHDDPSGSLYLRTTERILWHVQEENENGNHFPLWATCLGFERLLEHFAAAKKKDAGATNATSSSILEAFDAENYPINLHFTDAGWESRLFGSMTDDLFKEVASPVGRLAFNNHGLGIHPETFASYRALTEEIAVLTIDKDRNGKSFVSTIEGKKAPIYGTQWHPEKPPWEWNPKWRIARSEKAIEMSNFMGRFFVNECKYNKNKFEDENALRKYLLTNRLSLSGASLLDIDPSLDMPFTEIYCFGNARHNPSTDPQHPAAAASLTSSNSSSKQSQKMIQ